MKSKKVLVIGLGKSGMAAIKALVSQGADVSAYDDKEQDDILKENLIYLEKEEITCYFNKELGDLAFFDLVLVSPGVPLNIPVIKKAKELGIEIIGEVELAYRLGKGKYIGITGTNGKTTTTALTGAIFIEAGFKAEVVGNIGDPVIDKALKVSEDTWMIAELSSFQLESIESFHPKISAVLNLAPDHLDRHGSFEEYLKAKKNIFKNQNKKDYFVYNLDDGHAKEMAIESPAKPLAFSTKQKPELGAYVREESIYIIDENSLEHFVCLLKDITIKGWHNIENALAATVISYFAGVEIKYIKTALKNFKGVAHRQEFVGQISGINFVNDSKGTNPESSIKALEAIEPPIILIAGGYDKSSSFKELIGAFSNKVKAIILMGATKEKIKEEAEKAGHSAIYLVEDMEEAVNKAYSLGNKGDTVLLSPACASWGMYENFEERGEDFKSKVKKLEEK